MTASGCRRIGLYYISLLFASLPDKPGKFKKLPAEKGSKLLICWISKRNEDKFGNVFQFTVACPIQISPRILIKAYLILSYLILKEILRDPYRIPPV